MKMNLLISIKPEFVKKIILGEKKYEFRRSIFRQKVDKIYIYSTSPEKKIKGYFKSSKIINDTPENLWKNFKDVSGTSKEFFFEYFKGKETGFAIKIDDLHVFDQPIDTNKLKDFKAPQSFRYINEDLF